MLNHKLMKSSLFVQMIHLVNIILILQVLFNVINELFFYYCFIGKKQIKIFILFLINFNDILILLFKIIYQMFMVYLHSCFLILLKLSNIHVLSFLFFKLKEII